AARAEAALGLGQAALRDGLFQDAVDALTDFIDQLPDDANAARAHFMRGDAYLGMSRWQDAIADFEAYLARQSGLIDSYVYERLGDAQLGLGAVDAALGSYAQAVDASRSLDSQLALRERVAQILMARGDHAQALEMLEAILADLRTDADRARVELLIADTLLALGETERAMNRQRRIFENYPQQPQAYVALTALL